MKSKIKYNRIVEFIPPFLIVILVILGSIVAASLAHHFKLFGW